MVSILRCAIPYGEFELGRTLQDRPATSMEVVRSVPMTDCFMPCLTVETPDFSAYLESLRDKPAVESVREFDITGTEHFVYIDWRAEVTFPFVSCLNDHELLVRSVQSVDGVWSFSVGALDHEVLSAFESACRRAGIEIEVEQFTSFDEIDPTDSDLTTKQEAALRVAYQMGYFGRERSVTLAEIGAEIGVSRQAVSDRLNRGISHLIEQILY